jgi:hypothetical protein
MGRSEKAIAGTPRTRPPNIPEKPQSDNDVGKTPEKLFRVTPPQLNLPKGGGAIHGMSEKFAANPVMGAGSMNGQIEDATAGFAEEFRFKDQGIGLEFNDKQRLAEFFQKARELYPDSLLQPDNIFVSGDHVIIEWTLQTTVTEPFYAGLSRKLPISLHGTSIVRTENGKITNWSDYYGGPASRRTALASYFTEWVEY